LKESQGLGLDIKEHGLT